MTNKDILQADMLDILFEHRNKLYGAYVLRKNYSNRLTRALGVSLTIVLAVMSITFIKKNKHNEGTRPKTDSVVVTEVIFENKEIEPEKPRQLPPPQKSTADFNQIIIVPDDKADKEIADIDKISESIIGDKNIDGEVDEGIVNKAPENTGTGEVAIKEPEIKQPDLPSYPPEFPGGNAAWLGFLQRYLQSPEDLEPGQRVEVLVRFWVDVDGSVSRPEFIKSGGSSFDKEVLRVLRKMPKWKPAMQYGNLVAVAYTQPVIFMGVEE